MSNLLAAQVATVGNDSSSALMPHLQLCTTPTTFQTRTEEDCENTENRTSKTPSQDEELKTLFNSEMKSMPPPKEHLKVAVLMLSWDIFRETDMDVTSEVQALEKTFTDTYHYTVLRKTLNTRRGSKPCHQINRHLSEFVEEHDGEHNLLIIYYAGHAVKSREGNDLHLKQTDGSTHSAESRSTVVWREAAKCLDNTEADKLVIFDTCHAGILTDRASWRSEYSEHTFDFIGSTQRDAKAIGPGPNSFTTALIWALKELATEPDGFTPRTLLNKIFIAPNFNKGNNGQTPVFSEVGKQSVSYGLKLRPHAGYFTREESGSDVAVRESLPYRILLHIFCRERPSQDHITYFCNGLKRMVKEGGLPFESMLWVGYKDHREIVRNVLSHWRRLSSTSKPSFVSDRSRHGRRPCHNCKKGEEIDGTMVDDANIYVDNNGPKIIAEDLRAKQSSVQQFGMTQGSIINQF